MNKCMSRMLKIGIVCILTIAIVFSIVPLRDQIGINAATASIQYDDGVVDPSSSSDGYSTVLYDNSNGLPTSEANAVVMTSDGCIWIGSYSGLIRYDGNKFERIDSTTGIASVVNLFVDSKDRLWVATNDNGVAVMKSDGTSTMYGKNDGLGSASVRCIAEDDDENIYIATTNGISMMDKYGNLGPLSDPRIKNQYVRELYKQNNNRICGVTMEGAFFVLEGGQVSLYLSSSDIGISGVHTICPDAEKEDCYYIGTDETTVFYCKVDFQKKTINILNSIDTSPLEYINCLRYHNGKLWICSDSGIGVWYNYKIEVFKNFPMTTDVDYMTVDFQGNMWFASSRQGVMKIVENQFTDIFRKYGLSPAVVNSTCYCNNKLYVGMSDGLAVLNGVSAEKSVQIKSAVTASGVELDETDLIAMLDGCKIRSIIADSSDRIWISTFSDYGLIRYDNGHVVTFSKKDGLPSDRVRTVYERSDGKFLVACTGGVAVLDNDKVTKIYDASYRIANPEILTVTEAFDGAVMMGTDGSGIYIIHDGDNKSLHIGTEDGLMSDVVMRIKRDDVNNVYWLILSNSIAYLDSSYKIHVVKELPYSNNFDMYMNDKNEMWILSSNGIYVVPVEDLLKCEEINYTFYGMENGLPCISTANSYSSLTNNGDLLISGSTGVAKVNINEDFKHNTKIRLSVPYIDVDGVRTFPSADGSYHLSSDVRKISICAYVYSYSLMDPVIEYKLDGFDQEMITIRRSELETINYTNLKGGKYNFILKLQNSDQEVSIQIVKRKAFYESIWFWILCVILLIAAVVAAVMLFNRQRMNKLLKKQEENKTFIREMIEAFAKTIDMKDKYTNGHSTRVAEYTALLTKELGYDEETVEKYYNIALLHDIGKIAVPPEILNKPGKLTDEEFAKIKSHSGQGYIVLKDISIMPELAIGAGAHHERPDGKGYPKQLKGDEIPRVAQIIAVADTFDAMYSDRPYRKRMNFEKAVSIVKEVRGTQLTDDVVDAFLRLVDKGYFKDPNDTGGGSTEDIDNIHKKFNESK